MRLAVAAWRKLVKTVVPLIGCYETLSVRDGGQAHCKLELGLRVNDVYYRVESYNVVS